MLAIKINDEDMNVSTLNKMLNDGFYIKDKYELPSSIIFILSKSPIDVINELRYVDTNN